MTPARRDVLRDLERFGAETDARETDNTRRMRNITFDTGEMLSMLVRMTNARRVLEIGMSNGFSTIWLADGVEATGGRIETVDASEYKHRLARANFARAAVSHLIDLRLEDAGTVLRDRAAESVEFLFLDTQRARYVEWWTDIRRVIIPGGLLVVDNATSHPDEMRPLMSLIQADPDFTSLTIPVGKGEFVAWKCRPRIDGG